MPNLIFTDGNDTYTVTAAGDYWLGFIGGNDTLTVDGGTSTTALMGEGNDTVRLKSGLGIVVYGESGADLFDVWADDASAYGGGGNDVFTLRGGSGQLLYGDAGADRFYFYFNGVDVMLDGGSGNDIFYGNNRTISGNIYGGSGNDYFFTFNGGGALLLYGGTGNDTYRADPVSPASFVENPGEGTDTVQVSRGTSYTLPDNIEKLVVGNYAGSTNAAATLTGNALKNTIIAAGNADTIYGLGGNDLLYGKDGNDTLHGGDGHDKLYGGTGDDLMYGGPGNDIYYVDSLLDQVTENLGEGTDTVRITVSGYTLPDNVEKGVTAGYSLTLYGNALNNTLTGGIGSASLYGYGGNDVFNGAGIDTMYGGPGDDTFYVTSNASLSAYDTVVENPGEGTDTVRVLVNGYQLAANVENGYLISPGGWTLFGNSSDNSLVSAGDDATAGDTLYGFAGNDTLIGNDWNDWLDGGLGDDSLFGGGGNDVLIGYDGNDTIDGGEGGDTINGEIGEDVLLGGAGGDNLNGGSGADSLSGGDGFDRFQYYSAADSAPGSSDTITDFYSEQGSFVGDVLDLSIIDAHTDIAGNQAFALSGTTPAAHSIWYSFVDNGDGTWDYIFYGDTNGDTIPELEIHVHVVSPSFYTDDIIL